jgi:hypothetical protein
MKKKLAINNLDIKECNIHQSEEGGFLKPTPPPMKLLGEKGFSPSKGIKT